MTPVHDTAAFPHRWKDRVWDERDLDAIDDLVAEDFVGHSPALPEPLRGPEDVREFVAMLQAGAPDVTVEVEDAIVDGDRIAVRQSIAGTHEGPLFGVDPTGESFEIDHVSFVRIEDGTLAEEWEMGDHMALFEQLGVVEPPTG